MHIHYSLALASINEHLFEVTLTIPSSEFETYTLTLPTWIPGSYMVRDFSKNLHRLNAKTINGQTIEITQVDKQTWHVSNPGHAIEINYVIYAYDLSVRSAYITDHYAFANGTSVFLEVKEFRTYAHRVTLSKGVAPAHWKLASSMPQVTCESLVSMTFNDSPTIEFTAEDYQELIDHPILMGEISSAQFKVDSTLFNLVFTGEVETDIDQICEDLAKISKHHINIFKDIPCEEYWFLTLLSDEGFGGLEHRSSTALLFPRFHLPMKYEMNTTDNKSIDYQSFLSLCSHELFHTWHVKKTRPLVYLDPDLSQEVYSEQLWIYEGFTSFYDDFSLARTGLISAERYADIIAENITRLYRTPGAEYQSAAQSSFDAWTKFYKQDAGSLNHIVSYYNKGAIIALCLDITLRKLSNDSITLDNLVHALWNTYGEDELGTSNNVIEQLCLEKFNINVQDFVQHAVHSTEQIDLASLLSYVGLKLQTRARSSNVDKGGISNNKKNNSQVDFGATVKALELGVEITSVIASSAAAESGLYVGDRLISINGWQLNEKNLYRLLNNLVEQKNATMHVFREGRLLELQLAINPPKKTTVDIEIVDQKRFQNWIMSKA